MYRVDDIAKAIEAFAPTGLQEDFDNSGLLVGDRSAQVSSALLCVDTTEDTIEEAIELGVNMIISHHPIIFNPLKRLTSSNYVERIVQKAIKNDIALYACHTNLDAVHGGLSYRLAEMIGIENPKLLGQPNKMDASAGFGVVGELSQPIDTVEFLLMLKKIFSLSVIRHNAICRPTVQRIAVSSGSGAFLIDDAKRSGADIFIAADFKYNNFIDACRDIVVADIGHYESEYCAIELLFDVIRKKLPTFALHKSEKTKNPVNYIY